MTPVIGSLACQDIRVADMQRIVNAAPAAQEGGRLHALVSALVRAGIRGGYLANARLKEVHWQAGQDRPAGGTEGDHGRGVAAVRRSRRDPPGTPMSPSSARPWPSAGRAYTS